MTVADRVVAYIGLGANIGEPSRQLQTAFDELNKLPKTRVTASSSLYRSAPLDHENQPEFLNAVAQLDTGLAPEPLLQLLQEIENRHGRERPFRGAPRTLDLDLLLYGDESIASARLTVPHPRMHERAFVLQPLLELVPAISVPGKGLARSLLSACSGQKIEKIA
jgi:2-amino-4-hydroxy-6-hydroxymethyldihydropteridine diphosphokinase